MVYGFKKKKKKKKFQENIANSFQVTERAQNILEITKIVSVFKGP